MSRVEPVVVKGVRRIAPIGVVLVLCTTAAVAFAALARPTTVTTHQTKRGNVLAAVNGHALYMFSSDKTGKSNCSGSCTNTFLPLLSQVRPVAARGTTINSKLLGTIRRTTRTLQVTYDGHPLYTFSRDRAAGQIGGEGANEFGGHWYVVNPAGNAVKPKASGGGGGVCNPTCQGY
jgi:predicted lipoprotein with Yx(FWY)xxD motif